MESEKRPIILIAEDDESNYLLLFALLKRDYQIIHAHDGIEAIQLFKNFPPDAILMAAFPKSRPYRRLTRNRSNFRYFRL